VHDYGVPHLTTTIGRPPGPPPTLDWSVAGRHTRSLPLDVTCWSIVDRSANHPSFISPSGIPSFVNRDNRSDGSHQFIGLTLCLGAKWWEGRKTSESRGY
jgi:hypothetical protein